MLAAPRLATRLAARLGATLGIASEFIAAVLVAAEV